MKTIKKLKLKNFKKFEAFEIEFDDEVNIIIGDNEAGKSTMLSAIDLVLSGSRHKIESIGLENMFNEKIINDYLTSSKDYSKLPELYIEVYLNEQNNDKTSGKNNSEKIDFDGLRLRIKPNDEYSKNIMDILKDPNCVFPFEFYIISFTTFSDSSYNSFAKYVKHIFIDNSSVNA